MISYAQNFEDVMLARLFPAGYAGFYIDIGAADPEYMSVTKHFYDNAWTGINVEPLPQFFEKLSKQRSRDVNLRLAIAEKEGSRTFYETRNFLENSTLDIEVATSVARKED